MKVDLTKNGFYLNEFLIQENQTSVTQFIDLLGKGYREKPLEPDAKLYIFDDLGIRMWSKGEKVGQVQIVFNEARPDEIFPHTFYRGEVFIDGKEMSIPIHKTEIENKVGRLIWEDDSKRFGLNIFNLTLGDFVFSFWLDKNQETVDSFYS